MNAKQSDKRITALYARLSRDDEKEGISGSIQNQKVILEKFAKDNKLPNPRFFYDDGFSGVTFTRPAFMEMMELAEQGLIGTIVVKDHSRLGRNRLVVGQLLEEDFVRLDIRYIAIMDNIDTAKGISDLVPMQDLFNEWHAKNTSDKVRKVMQSKGMSGKPLTTNPPFGYMKNSDNKDEWIVDEPASQVVRKIFDLCVSGLGPTQIAKRLKAEKVLTPTEYWNSIGRKCGKPPERSFNWCSATVSDILAKQEYCGDTVNFRTTSKSFKLKKRLDRPQEDWQIFPNTHPAIIDRETFALVQELRQHRRRPTKSGIVSMFSGLLYCADCGEKLYYSVTNNYKREQAYFFCSAYRKNSDVCSSHYIREKVVEQLVLESMQRVLWYVQSYEKLFAQRQLEEFGEKQKKELAEKRRELDKAKLRVREIDGIIQKLYEDNATGKISDERFATMSMSLENEQSELKDRIPALENELENAKIKTEGLQRFIDKAKQVTRPNTLTPELVHEFIEKIVVFAPEYKDGKRYQEVAIYYNGVGIVREPTAEEMEEYFQEHISRKPFLKAKTA
ncbi:MAG: recombinase [Clostridiales bacterium]|nr:MAG: recombinase [Clostridiales bacterium]